MLFTNSILLCLSAYLLRLVWRNLASVYSSPLRLLPSPPIPSFLYGHVRQACSAANVSSTRLWVQQYGPNVLTRWLFMTPSLWTTDLRALNHILHSANYGKPWEGRVSVARIVGESVIIAEGEAHRKQRKVLNPAFGPAQVRELTGIFLEKAAELRDYWRIQVGEQGEYVQINVIDGLKKTTLDVIGLAGFDYHLDALNTEGRRNELNEAFHQIFSVTPAVSVYRILMDYLPFLDFFPDERMKRVDEAHRVMHRIGTQLIKDKKAAILREKSEESGNVERRDVRGKDLLTLLIKANMATDIPDDERLTEKQVLAQIPSFLVAGHETTSTGTAWLLCALGRAPLVQRKLREELLAVPTATPTMDELMALPYLDCVVRETLRLHAPVTFTLRVALQDDVIPVSEPFVDRHGKPQHEIRIAKGNRVILPFLAVHHSRQLWGDDALEFRPERWENTPEAISSVPGVWSHMLTFSGGPHACIGYRFAIVELKVLAFTLVRAFEFELAVPMEEIVGAGVFTQRPSLRSEPKKGAQLPMRVRPYRPL